MRRTYNLPGVSGGMSVLVLLALGFGALTSAPASAGDVLTQGTLPGTYGLKFGPDGRLYVGTNAGVAILDVDAGQLVGFLGAEVGSTMVEDVAFGSDGSLYWTAMFTGTVGRMAPDGAVTTQVLGPGVNPIAFSDDGRMFVSEPWFSDSLYEVDPGLEQPPRLIAQGLGGVKGMDWGGGVLWAALMWQGKIVRIDVDAQPVVVDTVAEGIPAPFTAKLGPDEMLYVVERTTFSILRMDPATGAHETYAELPFGPDNLAFNADGRLFVSSYSDGAVAEVLPDGSVAVYVPGGVTLPAGIAVMPRLDGGESVFVGSLFSLRELDGATGEERSVERYRFGGSGFGGAVSVSAAGQNLVLSNFFPQGRVQMWDPDLGAAAGEYADFVAPMNAISFGDDVVVVDLGQAEGEARVVRVGSGGATVLADVSDQIFVPLGLASDGANLWVGDWATGMVWQLIADGQVLAQPRPVASGLSGPEGMVLDNDGTLLVVEGMSGSVARVDPATGAVTPVVSGLALSTQGQGILPPFGTINGIDTGASGAIYVAGDVGLVVYKIVPQTVYVTAVANSPGHAGSSWSSDLELHNRGIAQSQILVELLLRGADNSAPAAVSLTLDPGLSARYPNVLDSLFGVTGAGALRLTSSRGDLLVSARTHTPCGAGRCSQLSAAFGEDDAVEAGGECRLIMLENTTGARTNVGVVSATAVPISVYVELYAADGAEVGVRRLELPPFGADQVDDLFHSLDTVAVSRHKLEQLVDAFAVVRAESPEARFFAYASVVDNATNDGYTVPGR